MTDLRPFARPRGNRASREGQTAGSQQRPRQRLRMPDMQARALGNENDLTAGNSAGGTGMKRLTVFLLVGCLIAISAGGTRAALWQTRTDYGQALEPIGDHVLTGVGNR